MLQLWHMLHVWQNYKAVILHVLITYNHCATMRAWRGNRTQALVVHFGGLYGVPDRRKQNWHVT